jgi:hypothetical protein
MAGVMEHQGPETEAFYRDALTALTASKVDFLVGGSYAVERYTGIARNTKDFDVFLRPGDVHRALAVLEDRGYQTELTFSHWLGKAKHGGDLIDVIFSSGSGVATVDDIWFAHAVGGELFGVPVRFCAAEEVIWQKGFVMERDRFDGADIAHILRARAEHIDWNRLSWRFGPHWRVLFVHLVLFGFIYPGERDRVPAELMRELASRLGTELAAPAPTGRLCQGTLFSHTQYLIDLERWRYDDARLHDPVNMTPDEIARWTAAFQSQ